MPPWHLLHRVLAQLAASGAEGVLVLPEWPAQAWWPLLLDVAVAWAPLGPADLRRVDGYAEPLAQPGWRLWAARVDGRRAPSATWA